MALEPITLANALATILGLIATYRSERKDKSEDDYKDFMDWLSEGRHEEVKQGIEANTKLGISIKALLKYNNDILLERLQSLDEMISRIASSLKDFSDIALAIYPDIKLSDQAISIAEQLVESGASKFMEKKVMTGAPDEYIIVGDSKGGRIVYKDRQFIEDDLLTLIELGLLRLEYGRKGTRIFHVTRAVASFVSGRG